MSQSKEASTSSTFSSASARSDSSKGHPPAFGAEPQTRLTEDLHMSQSKEASTSSTFSSASARSDSSKGHPPAFGAEPQTRLTEDLHMSQSKEASTSSTFSSASARSDSSKGHPPAFGAEPQTRLTEDLHMSQSKEASTSSTFSSASARSDSSKGHPPAFGAEPQTSSFSSITDLRVTEDLNKGECESETGSSKGHPPAFAAKCRPFRERFKKVGRYLRSQRPASLEFIALSARRERFKKRPPLFRRKSRNTSAQTKSHIQRKQDSLKVFENKTMDFVKQALRTHKEVLYAKDKRLFEKDKQEEVLDDQPVEFDDETKEAALKIALHILKSMKKDEHARTLEQSHYGELAVYQKKLKSSLKKKNENIFEDETTQRWPVPLKKIYTKLYLMEGEDLEVNNEHEVRLIEMEFNRRKPLKTPINCEDIFSTLPNQQGKPIRTVLTKGIAGIGKTVLVQKFVLDWSEEKANQDIQLLFPLPFRHLNLFKDEISLMELVYHFCPDLKEFGIKDLKMCKVLFILDGLDECRVPLDFKGNDRVYDPTQFASVGTLLTNLIAGNLLPEAHLWITTRPAAASLIPGQYVDRITVIRGFNNRQKEMYFQRRIDDENLAKRVIANVKSAKSLYIMCHVPVFCWISSIVLGKMCKNAGGGKMPKTLTQMYIHFVSHQTTLKQAKYSGEEPEESQGNNTVIMSLGKLAFQQLEKGNLIFYEDDVTNCGVDVKEASVYSGLCTQVFREESYLQQKVFCFVHLSVQEFLAALYVHVMYSDQGVNLLIEEPKQPAQHKPMSELHKVAVDRALQSNNGHLDLFLRFLLGLSLESSQVLLRSLNILVKTCDMQSHEETIEHIKGKINQHPQPQKYINLFHCLNELDAHSLLEEMQCNLDSNQGLAMDDRSSAEWAALVFVLLTSPERPEEINLKKYSRTEDGLVKLLPAIGASKSAMLDDCNLTTDSLKMLSSTLSSSSNELDRLNLSDNILQDAGIELLCSGLQSPHCRLKTLTLNRCSLTQGSCERLAALLCCPSSHLRELDLNDNDVGDSGVELLSTGLQNVSCKLETLRLSFCNITKKGCGFLASAVKLNPSNLSELDLSYNHLGEDGVELISAALEEGKCELNKLRVNPNAEHWIKPRLRKHMCKLTMDPDTAHKVLVLSDENRMICQGNEEQPYPDHPDRFEYWAQVLAQQGLTGRHYWEVEWEGKWVGIGVTYKGISRKGLDIDSVMGYNGMSWGLHCSGKSYRAYHEAENTPITVPLGDSHGLAVYLDSESGILSFYRVSPGRSLAHLHTFFNKFTESLYPIFRVWGKGARLRLRQAEPFTEEEAE